MGRRRSLRELFGSVALVALLAGLGIVLVGSTGERSAAAHAARPSLKPLGSCDRLRDYLLAQPRALAAYGDTRVGAGGMAVEDAIAAPDSSLDSGPAPPTGPEAPGSSTNVQEEGVDEPDIVKSNGSTIFSVDGATLRAVDVSGSTPGARRRAESSGRCRASHGSIGSYELILSGDRVLAIGSSYGVLAEPVEVVPSGIAPAGYTRTLLAEIDVCDPANDDRPADGDGRGRLRQRPAHGHHRARRHQRHPRADDRRARPRARAGAEAAAARPDHRRERASQARRLRRRPPPVAVRRPRDALGADDRPRAGAARDRRRLGDDQRRDPLRLDPEPLRREPSAGSTPRAARSGSPTSRPRSTASTSPTPTRRPTSPAAGSTASCSASGRCQSRRACSASRAPPRRRGSRTDRRARARASSPCSRPTPPRRACATSAASAGSAAASRSTRSASSATPATSSPSARSTRSTRVDLSDPADPRVVGELKIPGYSAYLHPVGEGLLLGIGQDATGDGPDARRPRLALRRLRPGEPDASRRAVARRALQLERGRVRPPRVLLLPPAPARHGPGRLVLRRRTSTASSGSGSRPATADPLGLVAKVCPRDELRGPDPPHARARRQHLHRLRTWHRRPRAGDARPVRFPRLLSHNPAVREELAVATGVDVWASAEWRNHVLAWADERLREAGIERTGEADQPHLKPWATVLELPTSTGPVWLKATGPGTAFEVGLYELLHRVAPERALAPIAVDVDRGWIVLPDGGPPLADRVSGGVLVDAFATILPRYGRLQLDLAPEVERLPTSASPTCVPRRCRRVSTRLGPRSPSRSTGSATMPTAPRTSGLPRFAARSSHGASGSRHPPCPRASTTTTCTRGTCSSTTSTASRRSASTTGATP